MAKKDYIRNTLLVREKKNSTSENEMILFGKVRNGNKKDYNYVNQNHK